MSNTCITSQCFPLQQDLRTNRYRVRTPSVNTGHYYCGVVNALYCIAVTKELLLKRDPKKKYLVEQTRPNQAPMKTAGTGTTEWGVW